MEYLEFEQPVKELIEQYEKCVQLGTESGINVDESCKKIIFFLSKKIFWSKR